MLPPEPPTELALPAFDLEALARRAAMPLAALAVAVAVLVRPAARSTPSPTR